MAWYLSNERLCVPWPPGRGTDLYQFGVPSSMAAIARRLAAKGLERPLGNAQYGHHEVMHGFVIVANVAGCVLDGWSLAS